METTNAGLQNAMQLYKAVVLCYSRDSARQVSSLQDDKYKGIDWGWRYRNLICLNIYHMCKYISTVFFGNHIVPGFIIIPFTAHIYFKLTLFVASKKMVHIEKWPTGYSTSLVSILLFYVNCLIMKKGLYSAVNLWTTESVPSQRWDTVRDKWIFYTLWIYPCGALLTLF